MLELAAVAGRHVDSSLLQELTGRPEPVLIQMMESLIAAQLIVETPQSSLPSATPSRSRPCMRDY